jgi:hypothetical protein
MTDLLDPGDSREWTYRERDCMVVKNDLGHWCGYARTTLSGFVPADLHDYEGTERHTLLDVHGGLTYGPDDDGWVGFDCGHARDLCLDERGEPWGKLYTDHDREPVLLRRYGSIEACEDADDCLVWRLADVRRETERLVDQLALLEHAVSVLC